ncbi:CU044_2847 family protein [Streptomyces sp. TRM76323]|uniref:CU044_2847 family protein n=1 Tax=Streptomyces tamarix TaxID=3078565 RepID=A0ABU3QUV0_9ACTN|nr:CU044_2847 family protein [Streptomyces tamarix]MDT9686484.1 CU044_2847 family protein [Streptomyces tamarix]
MHSVARIPLEGGGAVLVEAAPEVDGPVKAGRLADSVRELPQTLQQALGPVRDTARAVLEQLRQAGPDEVEVEFGVDLSAEAGAVITKGGMAVHLKVRVLWASGAPAQDVP